MAQYQRLIINLECLKSKSLDFSEYAIDIYESYLNV
jgi:hypothetical protein